MNTEWCDIVTAPKDGTPILLREGAIVASGQFGHKEPWQSRTKQGFYFDGASLPCQPTHWQPLPPPPEEQPNGR
jgi:hypothetical protein